MGEIGLDMIHKEDLAMMLKEDPAMILEVLVMMQLEVPAMMIRAVLVMTQLEALAMMHLEAPGMKHCLEERGVLKLIFHLEMQFPMDRHRPPLVLEEEMHLPMDRRRLLILEDMKPHIELQMLLVEVLNCLHMLISTALNKYFFVDSLRFSSKTSPCFFFLVLCNDT